ncbi:MAG: hypothetical protein WAK22_06720 [Candidatus Sulfotelmatobacter sp.]
MIVSEGKEDAVSELGLTLQAGRSEVIWVEVTVHVKSTAPLKVENVVRVRIEVAEPPGSIEEGWSCPAVSVNGACATEAAARESSRSAKKTAMRGTCLKFTISGRELTTSIPPTAQKLPDPEAKPFQMPVNGVLHINAIELLWNAPERILD